MTESVEWERLEDHEEGATVRVTPWWELSGMERELAKYDQCEEPGDCDHDHDNAIEYFREQELNELRQRAETAEVRAETAERELAELRERIGEGEVEWYVRWPTAGGRYGYELCESKEDAREAIPDGDGYEVVSRFVGDWKVADGGS